MKYRVGLLLAFVVVAIIIFDAPQAKAWGPGEVELAAEKIASYDSSPKNDLKEVSLMGSDEQVRVVKAEVQDGKTVRIAHIDGNGPWAIALNGDGIFHYINLDGGDRLTLVGDVKDTLVFDINPYYSLSGNVLYVAKNITNYLTAEKGSNGQIKKYIVDYAAIGQFLSSDHSSGQLGAYVNDRVYSKNRRFGVYWINRSHFVRVDFVTDEIKVIIRRGGNWYDGIYASRVSGITNDGRWVFMDNGAYVVDVGATCGVVIDPTFFGGQIDSNYITCPEKYLSTQDIAGYDGWRQYFSLSEDENEASYIMTSYPYSSPSYPPMKVTMRMKRPLKYLALGDSFSSGEGDIIRDAKTGQKHYREHTDDDGVREVDGYKEKIQPEERCHISTRSYPYLLARGMQLGDTSEGDWQMVTCAGAVTHDAASNDSESYIGQGARLSGYDVKSLKNEALSKFIPGRQKQIEFVKKYQPQVITLMMGGNDVDFGGKLNNCVQSLTTCMYASQETRPKLKKETEAEFSRLSNLYTEIAQATNNKAKIYVIGYPQFINSNPADTRTCRNTLFFDEGEREMAVNSVIYLNNIIEAAAKKAGVTYIDVENAFGNHRICDTGNQHVNSIVGVANWNGNQMQESFHPNHLGHEDLSRAILNKTNGVSLLNYQVCADATKKICPNSSIKSSDAIVPPYFKNNIDDDKSPRMVYYTMADGTLMKSTTTTKVIARGQTKTFRKNIKVDAKLYSDPTNLGSFMTDDDGGFNAELTIPSSVPAGYHTLVISGVSDSGELIDLYQTILLKGSDGNDVDEDGIHDSLDKCLFIPTLGIDGDQDGVDDACDPILDVPEKYIPVVNTEAKSMPHAVSDNVVRPQITIKTASPVEDAKPIDISLSDSRVESSPVNFVQSEKKGILRKAERFDARSNGKNNIFEYILVIGIPTSVTLAYVGFRRIRK